MRHEILRAKGRIAELKSKIAEKELEASGLIIQIRTFADPYENDMSRIKSGQIRTASKLLDESITTIKTLRSELERLEGDLG